MGLKNNLGEWGIFFFSEWVSQLRHLRWYIKKKSDIRDGTQKRRLRNEWNFLFFPSLIVSSQTLEIGWNSKTILVDEWFVCFKKRNECRTSPIWDGKSEGILHSRWDSKTMLVNKAIFFFVSKWLSQIKHLRWDIKRNLSWVMDFKETQCNAIENCITLPPQAPILNVWFSVEEIRLWW